MHKYYQSRILWLFLLFGLLYSCEKEEEVAEETNAFTDCEEASGSWNIQSVDFPSVYRQNDIFFTDNETGYAVGNAGSIMKSTDGGESWELIHEHNSSNSITKLPLTTVYFINDKIGFIGSEEKYCCFGPELELGALLLKTHDGGLTWSKKYFSNIYEFYEIIFYDSSHGLALVSLHEEDRIVRKILRTQDGGENWDQILIPGIKGIQTYQLDAKEDFISLVATDENGNTVMVCSNDHGVNWEIKLLPESECNRLFFINEDVGFASCGLLFFAERVYKTKDGGDTWNRLEGNPINYSSTVHFVTPKKGIVINGHYHWEQSGWEAFEVLDSFEIFETEDGGEKWSKTTVDFTCDLTGEYFAWDSENFCTIGDKFNKFEKK